MRLPTFYEQNLIPNWGIFVSELRQLPVSPVGEDAAFLRMRFEKTK